MYVDDRLKASQGLYVYVDYMRGCWVYMRWQFVQAKGVETSYFCFREITTVAVKYGFKRSKFQRGNFCQETTILK